MANNNIQKKKEIEKVSTEFMAKLSSLKKKRDGIVANFLEILKEKKLDEIRKSLKSL